MVEAARRAKICNELGMEPEELIRLKHITGLSKLFEDVEYKRAWVTKTQASQAIQRQAIGDIMPARKTHDAAVKLREYQDRDGNTKGEWLNVGAVIEYEDGGSCLLLNRTFNPAGMPDPDGRGTVRVSLFPADRAKGERRAAPSAPPPAAEQYGAMDDDIPFAPVSRREMP